MTPRKLKLSLVLVMAALMLATDASADISNAAVLYLRISPNARAAAMGDAYVAITDDANAVHWNPAGLGTYPLSNSLVKTKFPASFRPVQGVAGQKVRGGEAFESYDIWAITNEGLVRNDHKRWYTYEIFSTRTDQTLEGIVGSYFGIAQDNEVLKTVTAKVAEANAEFPYTYLENLRDTVVGNVPEGYDRSDDLTNLMDSLLDAYGQGLVNWERIRYASKQIDEGFDDGRLSETEVDRILFSIEKARSRYLPEEIRIHYAQLFDDKLQAIAGYDEYLIVGTGNGLFSYNGRRWSRYTTADGLPSNNVTRIVTTANSAIIGTDSGLVRFGGQSLVSMGAETAPKGTVQRIAAVSNSDVFAIVDGTLYHFDGAVWSSTLPYTVQVGDSPEKIADQFALYATPAERQSYLEKLEAAIATAAPSVTETVDTVSVNTADPMATPGMEDTTAADTMAAAEPAPAADTMSASEPVPTALGVMALSPGQVVQVPYAAGIRGEVTAMYVAPSGALWIGTEYGVLRFAENRWNLPGYDRYTVGDGETLNDVLAKSSYPYSSEELRRVFLLMNDLSAESAPEAGSQVWLYQRPNGQKVLDIGPGPVFATESGLVGYDDGTWQRLDGMGNESQVKGMFVTGEDLWYLSEDAITARVDGKANVSFSYFPWLPELADDLYFASVSAASGIRGFGTIGLNFKYMSYGTITRTGESSSEVLGSFDAFDAATTLSYGTSLTNRMKGGISFKFLYSQLSDQGAGQERGSGSATGFAVDLGLLYLLSNRLSLGLAVTNLGPDMAYIDAAQSDPLPRNMAFGFAYKLLQSEYYHLLLTAEGNKLLVGLDDGFSTELEEVVVNAGAEFSYSDLLAVRGGYVYDQEGDVKTPTVGFGLGPISIASLNMEIDFAYIPSNDDVALSNTPRYTFQLWW